MKYGRPVGTLPVTTDIADRLMRLPMHLEIDEVLARRVVAALRQSIGSLASDAIEPIDWAPLAAGAKMGHRSSSAPN
jgi:hypothetical protein